MIKFINSISLLVIILTCFTKLSFSQRGTPMDAYEFASDRWSASNIILWVIIILAGVYYLGKNSNKK